MGIGTALAIYFIIWWLVLFAVLPFGLKTQQDDDDEGVTLGTVASAPKGNHMVRAMITTTIISAIIFGLYFVATRYLGLGFDSLPKVFDR